jgi:hypothetical protein
MKDVNLSEDTIQKTEILMNSVKRQIIILSVFFIGMCLVKVHAQPRDLIGPVTADEIIAKERIFDIYIKRYKPEADAIEYLSSLQDSVSLYIFFGTWCRESKKIHPRSHEKLRTGKLQIH